MNPEVLIKCENMGVSLGNKSILSDISLQIKKGELISVVGKNGAGKSTLCKIITGNISLSSGVLEKKPALKMSYVPQVHNYNVLIPIKVIDFILLNNNIIINFFASDLIEDLGLQPLLQQQFKDLSEGEKQKVILLRALLKNPELLILDEPVSFVDFSSKNGVYDTINRLRKKYNFSVLMVSHDLHLVLKDTDWVLCLNNGTIGCQGTILNIQDNSEFSAIYGENWKYYKHHDI